MIAIVIACSGPMPTAPSEGLPVEIATEPQGPLPAMAAATHVVCAAGDLVHPSTLEAGQAVAALARELGCEAVLLLGDLVYEAGDWRRFNDVFAPVWGDLLPRVRPAIGNHEIAPDYFRFFGPEAGPAGLGYYAFEVGGWLFVSLNSETPRNPSQLAWLQDTLTRKTTTCEVLFWHIPLFNAGPRSGVSDLRGLFALGVTHGVELVLAAHSHNYQRFAPQTADGWPSEAGVRQVIVGTGGVGLRRLLDRTHPGLEVFDERSHGLLKLTLSGTSYAAEFVPIGGHPNSDSFEGTCR